MAKRFDERFDLTTEKDVERFFEATDKLFGEIGYPSEEELLKAFKKPFNYVHKSFEKPGVVSDVTGIDIAVLTDDETESDIILFFAGIVGQENELAYLVRDFTGTGRINVINAAHNVPSMEELAEKIREEIETLIYFSKHEFSWDTFEERLTMFKEIKEEVNYKEAKKEMRKIMLNQFTGGNNVLLKDVHLEYRDPKNARCWQIMHCGQYYLLRFTSLDTDQEHGVIQLDTSGDVEFYIQEFYNWLADSERNKFFEKLHSFEPPNKRN